MFGSNKIGKFLLLGILMYLGWIIFGLVNSLIDINRMYSDVYEKKMDINYRVTEADKILKK